MSTTPYGFDATKLRAARTAAGASVARIAREVGVTERAVSLYLAGTRVPKPGLLPRLAAAVGAAPADLCTVDQERLVHLRVFSGRTRAQMAKALGHGRGDLPPDGDHRPPWPRRHQPLRRAPRLLHRLAGNGHLPSTASPPNGWLRLSSAPARRGRS
ncbi:helix-turn-helix domain-containing protein [Kitasatospora nipponensis]|uniref:helix-turn-helix domain-containing protein n=1 Tax=Kitasatospora nipponensis TaxID=258049 RepID=UPI003CD0BD09